jgi:tetratricopeptide (TPR) repeat protein
MLVSRFSSRSMRQLLAMAVLASWASVGNAQAALTGAARWADSARVAIDRAYLTHDSAALVAAGQLIDKALTAFPNDGLLLHYRGYALYRLAMFSPGEETSASQEALLKQAVDVLRRSAALKPMAETHALLSSCLGTMAGMGMMNGMKYGSAAGEAGETARTLGPKNPRVLMLEGIGTWFKPAMWGGGKDKGYALMQQAVAAFGADAPVAPLPAWGRAEAYAWLGQMELDRGNTAAARAAYENALKVEPQFSWVRQELLPGLAAR